MNASVSNSWTRVIVKSIKILAFIIAVWIVTAMLWLVIYLFIIIPYQIENGLDYKGAGHKYDVAIQAGNGKEAIYWARRVEVYSGSTLRDGIYLRLGNAYALDGQHELAEHYFALSKLLKRRKSE